MGFNSMEEAQTGRLIKAFATLNVAPFGSLWRVPEEFWKRSFGESYALNNTRRDHPGCSLRKHNTTLGPIPMLHGTSQRSRTRICVVVKNIYGQPHTTYFGGLDPAPTPYEMWQGKNRLSPAEKHCLDPDEMNAMQCLCRKKGWAHDEYRMD